MATLTYNQALATLREPALSDDVVFDLLASIGSLGAFEDRGQARDLLLRTLARREEIPSAQMDILQSLVREHGLFPYLRDIVELPARDRLALEMHRPTELGDDLVFHAEQAAVYDRLMQGQNVVLSAPTSFGKSLVIDAVLAARDFRDVAVVVPTIALMDEARRRLARLAHKYTVITHGSQRRGARNLYVMTQERLLEVGDLPNLDFFVIDEFYKLDPRHSDDRAVQLNILFRRLIATGAQFYLLGPNISGLTDDSLTQMRAAFVHTDFTTVVTDVERVRATEAELPDALTQVCRDAGPGTLVFCRSPKRVRDVTGWLLGRDLGIAGRSRRLEDAAAWIASAYHPDWYVVRAIRQGIGVHHARLPRALGHHIVRLFNEGVLPYLLVTSTLIEGVNTSARTVVVLDNTIAMRKYDYFTFSNIRGRSGRMSRYFVGNVVVFNPTPTPANLTVDAPILTQPEGTPDEILIHVPDDELVPVSRARIKPYVNQDLVAVETLRQNKGIKLRAQLDAAEKVSSSPRESRRALTWAGSYPTSEQVRELAPLLFSLTGSDNAVRSSKQLGARINMLRHAKGDFGALVRQDIAKGDSADDAMESHLDFMRNWAQFKVPTALKAAESITNDVLRDDRRPVSRTAQFASEIENLFLPPFTAVLEEYGLPIPVSLKIRHQLGLGTAASLDDILDRLRELPSVPPGLMRFEQEMLNDTLRSV